jgi:hypothetical protein
LFAPEEKELEQKAFLAVERAFQLKPYLPEAHEARGGGTWPNRHGDVLALPALAGRNRPLPRRDQLLLIEDWHLRVLVNLRAFFLRRRFAHPPQANCVA